MSCDVGEVTERFGECSFSNSFSQELQYTQIARNKVLHSFGLVHFRATTNNWCKKVTPPQNSHRRKGWRMSWRMSILQPFRHFTYVTTHSPTLPSLYLHHSSFSNTSVASPTSQFILQPFFRFSYVTSSSLNSPGELPMTKAVLISTVRSYGWSF